MTQRSAGRGGDGRAASATSGNIQMQLDDMAWFKFYTAMGQHIRFVVTVLYYSATTETPCGYSGSPACYELSRCSFREAFVSPYTAAGCQLHRPRTSPPFGRCTHKLMLNRIFRTPKYFYGPHIAGCRLHELTGSLEVVEQAFLGHLHLSSRKSVISAHKIALLS
jgi:hypothetical protein